VAQLDTETAKLEQRYYKTTEYKELAVRQLLGLGKPGESVLILPANSEKAKNADKSYQTTETIAELPKSNFEQWVNFLFGSNSKKISG
jgi:hypothetical protein